MDDERFWSMIESAWDAVGGQSKNRAKLAKGEMHDTAADSMMDAAEEVAATLKIQLDQLSADDLLAFDRILERKLYNIDRADVGMHIFSYGSDDGFLYARGFIVAAGRAYYEAVAENPSIAMMDMTCEVMCYLPHTLYEAKFGPLSDSGYSRETGSNKAGHPDLR